MIVPGRPLRFLLLVAVAWVGARALIVWPTPGEPPILNSGEAIAYAGAFSPPRSSAATGMFRAGSARQSTPPGEPPPISGDAVITAEPATATMASSLAFIGRYGTPPSMAQMLFAEQIGQGGGPASAIAPPDTISRRAAVSPFSVSAWAIARGDGARALAGAGGQLGGSQAGFRAAYALGASRRGAVYGRLSSALGGVENRELAVGVDWQPIRRVPVRLAVERRQSLGGGRNAFAAGVFGGFDSARLPAGFTADGYGQAGIVGLKSRDAYADGALRVERRLWDARVVTVGAGAGAWGGIQPGIGRLDLGPQVVVRVPARVTTFRLGVDWRQRVAGDARPASGPTLSLGADF